MLQACLVAMVICWRHDEHVRREAVLDSEQSTLSASRGAGRPGRTNTDSNHARQLSEISFTYLTY